MKIPELPLKTDRYSVIDKGNGLVAMLYENEDAEYIVTACNLYPELLEALKELIEAEWMVTHDWGGDRNSLLDKTRELLIRAKQ